MVNLVLLNPATDINKCDSFGVNSFWIASYYSKIDVLFIYDLFMWIIGHEITYLKRNRYDVQKSKWF